MHGAKVKSFVYVSALCLEYFSLSYLLDASYKVEFDFGVTLTVHVSVTLANDQIDAQIFNTFITTLYMFQAISYSSSGGQSLLIELLVPSLSVSDRPVNRTVTY
jgi:hypothetical protein